MKIEPLLLYLPERLSKALINLSVPNITEIRLRSGSPVSVTCSLGNVTFDGGGRVTSVADGMSLTQEEIEGCVSALCKYSKYSYEEYIRNGFIPLDKGGRAGICGKVLKENGKFVSFTEITSINIRLNTFLPLIATEGALLMKKEPCGIAVYSPPGVGKTTYLKSLIHLLSTGKYTPAYRIGVVDERMELGDSILQKGLCDILSGGSKSYGIELFTRTMSSEIIVCDEVVGEDRDAILTGCNAGVKFVCSFHGGSLSEIRKRNFISEIFDSGIFRYAIGIEKSGAEYDYKITSIKGESCDKTIGSINNGSIGNFDGNVYV